MPANYHHANLDEMISGVIFGYYSRYETLVPIINSTFSGSNATSVDIYIDLMDILQRVDRYMNNNTPITNPLVVTSGIINMIAHYRNFFTTRYRCNTRFWIIDSHDNIIAKKYYTEFKTKVLSPNMAQIYKMNIGFLPMICNHIIDVQYEYTEVDFVTKSLAISNIESKANTPSILISKDPFAIQACAFPDMYVLRPKKNKVGDVSILSNRYSAVNDYINSINNKPQHYSNQLLADQLSIFMALTRVPSRSLKSLYTIPNTLNMMNAVILAGISNTYPWDFNYYMDNFIRVNSKTIKDPYLIEYRFKACDTVYIQKGAYDILPESKTYKGIVNLYDPEGIKKINNEYFKSCPLDLNVL